MDYATFAISPTANRHQRATHHVYVDADFGDAQTYAYDFGQVEIDKADFKQWVRETWGAIHQVRVVGAYPDYSVRKLKGCC